MRFQLAVLGSILAFGTFANPSLAGCGGSFSNFVQGLKSEAQSLGHAPDVVEQFFAGARQDKKVLKADRAQGVFKKSFIAFSQSMISKGRIANGKANAKIHQPFQSD